MDQKREPSEEESSFLEERLESLEDKLFPRVVKLLYTEETELTEEQ